MKEKNPNNVRIGEHLQVAREKANISQGQLARRLGISRNHLSDLERGIYGLSVDTLICCCKYLKTTPNELLDYEHLKRFDWRKKKSE